MKLAELVEKYKLENPERRYEPDPECKKCKGEGEYLSKALGRMNFCPCLYFARECRDQILTAIAQSAKAVLKELKNEKGES